MKVLGFDCCIMQFSLITMFTSIVFASDVGVSHSTTTTDIVVLTLNSLLFLVELAWEWAGARAVNREDERAMYAFWALSTCLPAFIIGLAADYFDGGAALFNEPPSLSVEITIAVFALLTLANRAVTCVCSVILFRKFGEQYRGLRAIIEGGRLAKFDRQRVAKRERGALDPKNKKNRRQQRTGGGGAAMPNGMSSTGAGTGNGQVVRNPVGVATLHATAGGTGILNSGAPHANGSPSSSGGGFEEGDGDGYGYGDEEQGIEMESVSSGGGGVGGPGAGAASPPGYGYDQAPGAGAGARGVEEWGNTGSHLTHGSSAAQLLPSSPAKTGRTGGAATGRPRDVR
jgi:hypothetical protein